MRIKSVTSSVSTSTTTTTSDCVAATRLFGDRFGESPVPVGLVISPDDKIAWVAATQSDVVVVVEVETLEVIDLIRTGIEPDGMAYTQKH